VNLRFFKDGPSIPDELLIARDEGRVVFFCGAGVSRAVADLPDFFGLAEKVIARLGVSLDAPARRILEEARALEQRTGVGGLISADRVFGILERDFLVRDIHAAVAETLKPKAEVDTTAHRTLTDLATTPAGLLRLVTTNFDRLFEQCSPERTVWYPPRLPDPARPTELNGIIHLHGVVAADYSDSEGDGFILSSSEFGHAYLADGWATEFFRGVIARYTVVFVGYAADDPPVQYLLEALRRSERLNGVYAFQSGLSEHATSRWHHKGVQAIAYSQVNRHQALWDTLVAWAGRARAPEEWSQSLIQAAQSGPVDLASHQRGQVAHIVSTIDGAKKFAAAEPPPPAEWLCVFDPFRRYGRPERSGWLGTEGTILDPFDLYGLDDDQVPSKVNPENPYAKRETPSGAWDAFALHRLDKQGVRDEEFSAIRGHWAVTVSRLLPRLFHLSVWISRVAADPASAWWASGQTGLHPTTQALIRQELNRSSEESAPLLRRAWRYLFEAWESDHWHEGREWYELKAAVDRDGWDGSALRTFAEVTRPYLKAERSFWAGPTPPQATGNLQIEEMFRLEVKYPTLHGDISVPDEYLCNVVRDSRNNLEHAVHLELELGGRGLDNISPITPDDDPTDDRYSRSHGLSGHVIYFAQLFQRLAQHDLSAASGELAAWPTSDDYVFSRLRIWAAGLRTLTDSETAASIIMNLSDEAFWSPYHQRDFLLSLAKRWNEFASETRGEIELRILRGQRDEEEENGQEFERRSAWNSVNRLTWLAANGCDLSSDADTMIRGLREKIPDWKLEYASKAAVSLEGGTYWVQTETDYSELLKVPLGAVLSTAHDHAGRSDNFRIEKDPFAGLTKDRPTRALGALIRAAKQGNYPKWAWDTFLYSEGRKRDRLRLSISIAAQLSRCPEQSLSAFVRAAADWLNIAGETLARNRRDLFDRVFAKITSSIHLNPTESRSGIVRGDREPDWTMEAINAPVGKLAQALFHDPRKDDLEKDQGFPTEWLSNVLRLLTLTGDLRRHALVVLAHNLNWLYYIDPGWTETNLLTVLDGDPQDCDALLSGFLWGARVPSAELFPRMKPVLLDSAKSGAALKRGSEDVLAAMLLSGWGTRTEDETRYVTNIEMHDVLLHSSDEFRSRILWQVERWSESEKSQYPNRWRDLTLELLRDVWPRQVSAKTSTTSARLFDFAFANAERFTVVAPLILPLLVPIEQDYLSFPHLHRSHEPIPKLYPELTLQLLYAVLPENVGAWPYGIDTILREIGQANSSLRGDAKLLELNRKWNSR
jgi:hypothetical protein